MAPIIDLAAERAARLRNFTDTPLVDPQAPGTLLAPGMLRLIPLSPGLLSLIMPQLAAAKLPPGLGLRLAAMVAPTGPDAA